MAEKTTPATPMAPAVEKLKKTDAVRRILQKLGKKAMPKEIAARVKEEFGLDITPDYAGKIKTEVFGKSGRRSVTKKPVETKPAETKAPEKAPSASNGKSSAVLLSDILVLKDLVDRVGADHVVTLIGVMSR
jgi:actin-like ATPase involved in cell morphogenesis